MPNLFEPDWDAERDDPPFRWRRARLGRQAGARDLGASLFELPPGAATFPLHAHFANEELLVVLAGRPTLTGLTGHARAGAGRRGRLPGRPRGRAPPRQPTDEPARVLIVSTMKAPEINEMLEDGSFWVRDYAPGLTPDDPTLDVPGLRPADG